MSKPVLLAALLGGILGAVFNFALTRSFPPTPKPPPQPTVSEARQYADSIVHLLKAGKYDEFFAAIRPAFPKLNEDEFKKMRESALKDRAEVVKEYGTAGEFEFSRETTLTPSLVRISYVEKYERGCVVYYIAVYNSPEGWRVLAFGPLPLDAAFALAH